MDRNTADSRQYSDDQLRNFYNSAPRTGDRIDTSSKEGRILKEAGWVNQDGAVDSSKANFVTTGAGIDRSAGGRSTR